MPFIFLLVMLLGPVWVWFWWRVEPGNGEIAVLIKKTGKNLPVNVVEQIDQEE